MPSFKIEKTYKEEMPELSLSAAIGAESPYNPAGLTRWLANRLVNDKRLQKTGKLYSDAKIALFYKSVMLVLLATTALLALLGGIAFEKKTPPTPVTSATAPVPTLPSTSVTAPTDQLAGR
jgi:hypothetical protein